MLTYRGGAGLQKGIKIKRFAKGYRLLKYVPICGVYREAPNEAPAGLLRGAAAGAAATPLRGRGCCYSGAAAAGLLLWEQAKRNGAGGLRPANGERVRTFPNHL